MDNPFYKAACKPLRHRRRFLCPPFCRPFVLFHRSRRTHPLRSPLTPIACVVLALLRPGVAHAQADETAAPIPLKPSPMLREQIPDAVRTRQPTFLFGDSLSGRPDLDVNVRGSAELRKGDTSVRADTIDYYQPDDKLRARGNVIVNRAGNSYRGPELDLKVDAFEGFFIQPSFRLLKNDAYGDAERIDFVDEKHAIARNASYSTCQRRPGPSWLPDWILNASAIRIDQDADVGTAEDAVLRFKGVPIMAVPSMSFPLSDARKSGWLPPTFNIDNTSGIEVAAPYYWNLAPNRDATLYASGMSRRGFNLGGELRYLEPSYKGTARLDWMPTDSLRNGASRWGLATTHGGSVDTGLSAVGGVGVSLRLNRVSDNNYWSDFPRAVGSLTQRQLSSEGGVAWGRGNFSLSARALSWQTLQDPASVITPPYDRLPQITGRYIRNNVNGFNASVETDYTRFRADSSLTLQPNAERSFVLAQVSRPWVAPGWYVTPKLQLNAATYRFDSALVSGATTANRTVPTLSLDSGLVFERSANYFGRSFTQTLEPRAFYVYTPYREQNGIPVYDSGANDFNFATIFTENPFSGNDRIADNNLLTLGVTSRLLNPSTGAEAVRLGIAQRLRFKDQRVTLPGGAPDTARVSDLLLGATVNWDPRWTTDSTIQYNQQDRRSERVTVGGRYSPGNYRVLSAAYRYQRAVSDQLDLGWQWPLNDLWGDRGVDSGPGRGLGAAADGGGRWYSVGRLNYSFNDRSVVDTVLGFEYDAGCWLGRIVVERLSTTTSTASSGANKRILFQLEFVGFSRLGTSPLQTLRQNIPRYQYLRENITKPSRFSNYD